MRKKLKYIQELSSYPLLAVGRFEDAQKMKGKWSEYFGNDNPIVVDYGMGRGGYILALAQKHPELNFLGLEVKCDRITQACHKVFDVWSQSAPDLLHEDLHERGVAGEYGLSNIRFVNMWTANLADIFSEGEISRVMVNCPDPNERTREQKRRLYGERNISSVLSVLSSEGEVWLKTDHLGYFEDVLPVLEANTQVQFVSRDFRRDGNMYSDQDPHTEYEQRWLLENRTFYVYRGVKGE